MEQARTYSEFPSNPWFSIWTRPRDTIQRIVDSPNPQRFVLFLAALNGISGSLDRASSRGMGDRFDMPVLFAIAIVGGSIGGIVSLYIGGALVRWTGGWLGGRASSERIRAAIAWGLVPALWVSLLWIPEILLVGQEMFTTETPRMDANIGLAFALLGMVTVEAVGGFWAVVTTVKCLGQVQGFSAWRALGNVVLAMLVVAVPLIAIAVAISPIFFSRSTGAF